MSRLTEEQTRAVLSCAGFELAEPVEFERHCLQCDCDACLNGSPSEELDQ